MNVLYFIAAFGFIYEFVKNQGQNVENSLYMEVGNETKWSSVIDNYVVEKNEDVLMVQTSTGEVFYSEDGQEIFSELYQGTSIPLMPKVIFSSAGIYYVTTRDYGDFSIQLGINTELVMELVTGMITISVILNIVAILLGSLLIYKSIQKWSLKLSNMAQEISQIDLTTNSNISIPDDPTEIKEVALSFNQLLVNSRESIEREKQFITNASHDLRTPVAAIRGHVNLIKRRGKEHPEIISKSIDFIDTESKRLEKLSNQLLTLEKKELELPKEKINLSNIVRNEVEKMRLLSNHHIDMEIEEDVELIIRESDVQQILQNLMGNSIKYSPNGTKIEVKLTEDTKEITMTVADQGIGISDEDKERVFHRFYRVDDARTSQIEGSGIGLSIVKKIVTEYGGRIILKDNVPQGVRAVIKIPKN